MLREITLKEAIERYIKGEDVKTLILFNGEEWENYEPGTLKDMFEGVRFLVDEKPEEHDAKPIGLDEPAAEDDCESEAEEMEIVEEEPIPAEEIREPAPKKKQGKTKRLELDEGRIGALYKAGWTYTSIAEDMGVSDVTIANRIKEMKARGEL